MKTLILDIIFWLAFFVIGFFGAYRLLQYTYGKDYKKWKPMIFTKDVTFKSMFFSKKNDSDRKEKKEPL